MLWRCWFGGRKGIRPVKKWVVRCWHGYLSGARCRLAYAQLMPLLLTVSCFSKFQMGFTFLLLAHLGSPRQRAVKWVCVCVCCLYVSVRWLVTGTKWFTSSGVVVGNRSKSTQWLITHWVHNVSTGHIERYVLFVLLQILISAFYICLPRYLTWHLHECRYFVLHPLSVDLYLGLIVDVILDEKVTSSSARPKCR